MCQDGNMSASELRMSSGCRILGLTSNLNLMLLKYFLKYCQHCLGDEAGTLWSWLRSDESEGRQNYQHLLHHQSHRLVSSSGALQLSSWYPGQQSNSVDYLVLSPWDTCLNCFLRSVDTLEQVNQIFADLSHLADQRSNISSNNTLSAQQQQQQQWNTIKQCYEQHQHLSTQLHLRFESVDLRQLKEYFQGNVTGLSVTMTRNVVPHILYQYSPAGINTRQHKHWKS